MDEEEGGGMSRIVRIVIIVVVLIVIVNIAINVAMRMRSSGEGHEEETLSGDELSDARARIEAAPMPEFVKRRVQDAISKAEEQRARRQGGSE